MRKLFSYIILGLSLVVFVYVFTQTGSFIEAITIAGIGLAWFLFENLFDLLHLFGKKSDDKINNDRYKKNKGRLEKKTEDNPTIR